nr:MAG TPA: hypothetical protein [Caudoviricetes sp.]
MTFTFPFIYYLFFLCDLCTRPLRTVSTSYRCKCS